jgi:peptidyl-prolyl cis-trans isomerase C
VALCVAGCRKAPEQANSTQNANPGAAALAVPPKPVPATLPDVLARVNGEDVKKSEFDVLVRNMEMGKGPIPAERRDEVLRNMLDQLITYRLLQQEAKARNITAPDSEVDARIQMMQSQFPNEEEFRKALEARRMSVESLRSDTRNDIVITKMIETEVGQGVQASDEDARAFYEKNPDKFKQDEMIRASHILLMVDEKADAATKKQKRAEIDKILKRARAGEDFAKLAKAHSQDGSAAQGGDLNYFTHGRMVPPFEQAAFALKTGEISDVVTTQFGYHIIKVTDRRPPATVPLATVNAQLKEFLTQQKKKDRADAFIAGLKQKSKIEVLI